MFSILSQCTKVSQIIKAAVCSMSPNMKLGCIRSSFTGFECSETRELVEYLDNLKNYEKSGVPENAGIDSDDGFDLGRMRCLMDRLGNPQSKYKVVHIAGTKGKGSTAAFLSNILRAAGYSVGCYTSPHIRTIRERMSVGAEGEPVSASELHSLFLRIKKVLDQAVAEENGCLSHFEVLTGIAFTLFAHQNVDVAVIEAGLGGARDATNVITSSELAAAIITTIGKEHLAALGGSLESIALAKSGIVKHGCPVILGGPFLPHIEDIIRAKALSMHSRVISAFDSGSRSLVRGFDWVNGEPCQTCDVLVQIGNNEPSSIELRNVHLSMLGHHQLQNALTATCAALCLRDQGWRIPDSSVRTALENTRLFGRSQFLKKAETEVIGLSGSMVLLDGAHTQASAKALADTISVVCRGSKVVVVVAMASDKDHVGFAREILSGLKLEAVFLTEVNIAGDKCRTAPALFLKDSWSQACMDLGIEFVHEEPMNKLLSLDALVPSLIATKLILSADRSIPNCLKAAHRILKVRTGEQKGIIVVTGSLHIVSSVLDSVCS